MAQPFNAYTTQGGGYSGGTEANTSFDATRFASNAVADISLFRNRAYDQRTGQWLQEDPIGVAGGINLYQFNGNNPVAFSDPFGLCVNDDPTCPFGQRAWNAFKATVNNAINSALSTAAAIGQSIQSAGKWVAKEAAIQGALALTTEGAGNAIRALRAADLAVDGLRTFEGTMEVAGSKATVFVNMVEGETSATSVISALKGVARNEGASVFRIEGRVANERLYNVLSKRYGLQTQGGIDFFEIPLK